MKRKLPAYFAIFMTSAISGSTDCGRWLALLLRRVKKKKEKKRKEKKIKEKKIKEKIKEGKKRKREEKRE